ncbi:hypothetical protein VME0621_01863 [Vibrio mediterranei]|uniref:Uncharacterized protein n=1 Tax=Vibrio mediterranei TaxID=689 RepID=A0ABX5D8A2_9VIBR|nr:hypothetical protein [Vibrio mediterranei]MCG9660205.1 hypothetical protein [Vibrio mediterranei]MCG9662382.1 hypothetical protein [Vibrio mediterranei]PCD87082.1 hypothetical protein COR52_17905 [Vibrio mediterranei]PRQ65894.1 hypothetical protein COR51_19755 [Vibrio mediterranei]PTC02555.1 hypothetical protein C9980_22505 [Vibrio mediterranei]
MIKDNQPRSEHQSKPNKLSENSRDPLWLTVSYTVFTYLLLSYVLPHYVGTETAVGTALVGLLAEYALYVSSLWLLPELIVLLRSFKSESDIETVQKTI